MMDNFESDIEYDEISENDDSLEEYTKVRVDNYIEHLKYQKSAERNDEIRILREIRNMYKPEEETTEGSDDGYLSGTVVSSERRAIMNQLEEERSKLVMEMQEPEKRLVLRRD